MKLEACHSSEISFNFQKSSEKEHDVDFVFTEELTSSAVLRVTPSREPLFTRKLDVVEVMEGRTARFDCKVSGSPAPRLTWMHFGKKQHNNVLKSNPKQTFNTRFLGSIGPFLFSHTMFCQRHEWRRMIMFTSSERGGVTHLSSPTLAAPQKAFTLQSLRTFTEGLNVLLSCTYKNPELPFLHTCKRSPFYFSLYCFKRGYYSNVTFLTYTSWDFIIPSSKTY